MELLLCHSRRHLRWTHLAVPARAPAVVIGQRMPSRLLKVNAGLKAGQLCSAHAQAPLDMSFDAQHTGGELRVLQALAAGS